MTIPFNPTPSHFLQNKNLKFNMTHESDISLNSDIPHSSNAKRIMIRTVNNFDKFVEKAITKNFPYLFVFGIHEVDDLEKVKDLLSKKFHTRPLILEFRTKDENLIFFKHDKDFIKHPEIIDDTLKYDFPHFLRDLSVLNENELALKVCESENHLLVRLFNIFNVEIKNRFKICDFFVKKFNDPKVDANELKVELFKTALDISFESEMTTVSEITIEIISHRENNQSILKSALEAKIENLIFFILNNFRDVFLENWDLKYMKELSAIVCGYQDELKDLFLFLIESYFPYPDNFDESPFNKVENSIIKCQKELHDAIADGGEKIIEIIDKVFAGDKDGNYSDVCYDFANISLLRKAFEFCQNQGELVDKSERYKIYVYLKVRGFKAGSDKILIDSQITENEITKNEKNGKRKIIEGIKSLIQSQTLSMALPHSEKHLKSLSMKSRVKDCGNYNLKRYRENSLKIDKFYKDLAEIPETFEIMKVVAESDLNIQIYFDFSQTTTHEILFDTKNVWGVAYPDGKIVIGAKDEKIALRTLAHELSHLAMLIVYDNCFRPYHPDRKDVFKKIVETCKNLKRFDRVSEDIVPRVFGYPKNMFQGDIFDIELIVRVPEMIADFKGNVDGLKACESFYPTLFNHFHTVTLIDIKNHDQKRREIVGKLNDAFGQKTKIFITLETEIKRLNLDNAAIIITNAPKVAMAEIHSRFGFTAKTNVLFVSAKKFWNSTVYQKEYSKIFKQENPEVFEPTIVVNLSTISRVAVLKSFLKKILPKKEIKFLIILSDENLKEIQEVKTFLNSKNVNYSTSSVTYLWDDLMPKTKQQILERKIKFQNCENYRLNDFLFFYSKIPKSEKFLSLCLSKNDLTVNKIEKLNISHIERTFEKLKFEEVERIPRENFDPDNQSLETSENVSYKFEIGDENVTKLRVESSEVSEGEILETSRSLQYFLISGNAGSGKSQSLMKIRENFIKKNPQSLCYIINLKLFIKNFAKIESEVDFKEFFIENFLSDIFERIFFEFFYKEKNVLIFFDGFDEISPVCKEKALILIKAFEGLKGSQLWITTRSHFEVYLRSELKLDEIYSLNPLKDENEIHQFFKNYWKFHELSGDLQKLASKLIESLKNGGNFVKLPSDPQTLTLFADACIKNGEIDDNFIKSFTKHKIYQKSIVKKIQIWSHERGDQGKEFNALIQSSDSTFAQMHQFFALKSFFINVEENYGIKLHEIWNNEEIIRCGIITQLDENLVIFQHETFKEFFVADFALKGLKKLRNHEEIFELLGKFLEQRETFYVVNMFVSGGLREIEFNDREIEKFSKVLEKIVDANYFRFLTTAVMENYESLYRFLLRVFQKMKKDSKVIQLKRELIFTDDIYKIEFPNSRVRNFEIIFDELCSDGEFEDFVKNDLKEMLKDFMVHLRGASMIGKKFKELKDFIEKHLVN